MSEAADRASIDRVEQASRVAQAESPSGVDSTVELPSGVDSTVELRSSRAEQAGRGTETLYPAFLDLRDLPVVVVGGGPVAAGKLAALVDAGARVTIVAPALCDEARAFVEFDDVQWLDGEFRAHYLGGARWVVAAATPDVNREVAAAATARGLFVNAVDDVANASAYLGGVVRRGDITIAISTRGLAPALAGLLREAIDAVLPDELERWVDVARAARRDWKSKLIPMASRRPLLLHALNRIYSTVTSHDSTYSTASSQRLTDSGDSRTRSSEAISGPQVPKSSERAA